MEQHLGDPAGCQYDDACVLTAPSEDFQGDQKLRLRLQKMMSMFESFLR